MRQLIKIVDKLVRADNFENNLEFIQQLINELKIIPNYPIILIGGTNGKGSTCAYLTNILKQSGYKVGTFTSPHVFDYNERICINNIPIDNVNLDHYLELITGSSDYSLGLFKTFTLASHLYFIANNIDIAVYEVGIGGKNDVTNLFEPTISAITGVTLDHCHILGNTISKIALEKAHIYRPNKWAFYGSDAPPQTLVDYAKSINAKLEILNTDFGVNCKEHSFDVWCNNNQFYALPYPSLRGNKQVYNVAVSLAILTKLQDKFSIPLQSIKSALVQTKIFGRFDVMPGIPQIIFDVAHNPQAVQIMLQNMVKLPFVKQNIAIFGIAKDKDIETIIDLTKNTFDKWYIAKINSERGTDNRTIKKILTTNKVNPNNIIEFNNIEEAMNTAIATALETDRIVCFGSFLVVECAYKQYNIIRTNKENAT